MLPLVPQEFYPPCRREDLGSGPFRAGVSGFWVCTIFAQCFLVSRLFFFNWLIALNIIIFKSVCVAAHINSSFSFYCSVVFYGLDVPQFGVHSSRGIFSLYVLHMYYISTYVYIPKQCVTLPFASRYFLKATVKPCLRLA